MSDTYTPTMKNIEDCYVGNLRASERQLRAEFAAALAAHDAEVAAKAWDEGAERATEFERGWLHAVRNGETVPQRPQNPYRKAVQS